MVARMWELGCGFFVWFLEPKKGYTTNRLPIGGIQMQREGGTNISSYQLSSRLDADQADKPGVRALLWRGGIGDHEDREWKQHLPLRLKLNMLPRSSRHSYAL